MEVPFKRAELPTLLNRRLQDICILMYNLKVKHKFNYVQLFFISVIFSTIVILLILYDNRNSLFLDIIHVTYGKYSLRYPSLWGKFPPDFRSAKTLNIFLKAEFVSVIQASMTDNGCKGCSLCSSSSYNLTIFLNFISNTPHFRFLLDCVQYIMHSLNIFTFIF